MNGDVENSFQNTFWGKYGFCLVNVDMPVLSVLS